ncbi:hypothetical protein LCGC14_1557820 [marine sediment metagenome]|uniref:Uncharacterized protein n=1 Tax=marine sediment metagenome TaxID=412755 RepID=A0A0F9L4R0_9ZZZZ
MVSCFRVTQYTKYLGEDEKWIEIINGIGFVKFEIRLSYYFYFFCNYVVLYSNSKRKDLTDCNLYTLHRAKGKKMLKQLINSILSSSSGNTFKSAFSSKK